MQFTHIVSLGGETHKVNPDNYQEICDQLVLKYGGQLKVETIDPNDPDALIPVVPVKKMEVVADGSNAVVQQGIIMSGGINLTGLVRATTDEEAARKSGFAVKQPIYALGTAVNSTGVANANRSRLEHEQKPFVREYCDAFKSQIEAEQRSDILVPRKDIRMTNAGRLMVGIRKLWLNESAFDSMVARMDVGGSGYLSKCWPELRAININQWCKRFGELEDLAREEFKRNPPKRGRGVAKKFNENVFNIRTRVNPNHEAREVFGVVTDSYTTFDVDKVAEALKIAAPADARGTVTYDGERARFEVLWHSDIAANEFCAGEIFKAGVIIKTADDGSGGLNVWAVVWRNLCRNLIIVDEAKVPTARIRHIGSLEKLVAKFQEGFKDALERVEHFRNAWGYAVSENVIERSQTRTDEEIPINIQDALPGFFFSMLRQDLITVPNKRKKDVVVDLVRAYNMDPANNPDKLTRASLVNAITRYAHEGSFNDSFVEDDLQVAAGSLLFGKRNRDPEIIQYLPINNETVED